MNRSWNILCWNVWGLNAAEKWPSVRNKIEESNCEIFFKKQRRKLLILLSLETSHQDVLMNSFMLPRGGFWCVGMAVFLMALLLKFILLQSRSVFLLGWI